MEWIINHIWVIPGLPLMAAGAIALMKREQRTLAASLALGGILLAFIGSVLAFWPTMAGSGHDAVWRHYQNHVWFQFGNYPLSIGWVLDPLAGCMLVMVTLVSGLIFVFSLGYMAEDSNFTRFFCFMSLFAAAMLGIVVANSLLLLFICWELVGLASYLLIGFWFHKPSAAEAARKAFLTTRIGDLGFLLGMVWLYARTGTLLFYDGGQGCLEAGALEGLVARATLGGLTLATCISLLIFCGAIGKSGQVPLHVWLPDAMEGPTPVSALIHAATMVAAGVFLMARIYPLLDADPAGVAGWSPAMVVVAWTGAITALMAAAIAVAQTDIKRILAYSTISQLGYMMMALGVGGYAAGMFHLLTHAFFKALLFLGAGSVIHGCHHEQDIRRLGGLRRHMPVTFATYAIGMMALAGVPLLFSGFWSKDEILHEAMAWPVSRGPFFLGLAGAFLTAFYMTRQMVYVFAGDYRGQKQKLNHSDSSKGRRPNKLPHESPAVMTVPLIILAVGAVGLGFINTPFWPGFHRYLTGHEGEGVSTGTLGLMIVSGLIVGAGLGLGWVLYGRKPGRVLAATDPLEVIQPQGFRWLGQRLYWDEVYQRTVIAWTLAMGRVCDWIERNLWENAVAAVSQLTLGFSWASRLLDEYGINLGFDRVCDKIRLGGRRVSAMQNGQVQHYLRSLALALAALFLLLAWGGWR